MPAAKPTSTIEKQYLVLEAISSAVALTTKGKPIYLHPTKEVKGLSLLDFERILRKLQDEDKVIIITKESQLTASGLYWDTFMSSKHISETFGITVTDKFDAFYDNIKRQCFEGQSSPRKPKLEYKQTPVAEKTLKTREHETLLKLIIGMAMKGYRYDPRATKNPAVKEIADDLAELGISVSDDTVRKRLLEAAEFLPHEPQKS